MPNLTDELSAGKARRLSQFSTAVLVWYAKSVKYDRVCPTFFELNFGSTHGAPSESDVTPISLQTRTYSIRFGPWKAWRLNQASNDLPLKSKEVCIVTRSPPASLRFKAQATEQTAVKRPFSSVVKVAFIWDIRRLGWWSCLPRRETFGLGKESSGYLLCQTIG